MASEQEQLGSWRKLANKELRGGDVDDLFWESPEGIKLKPLYTAADLEGLDHIHSLPGLRHEGSSRTSAQPQP